MRRVTAVGTPSVNCGKLPAGSHSFSRREKLGATTAPPTTKASVAPIPAWTV